MKYSIFFYFVFSACPLAAQSISFIPTYTNSPLILTKDSQTTEIKDLQITSLRFYISKVELYHKKERVFAEDNSFHLLDASVPESLLLDLELPDQLVFSQIKFQIGIDSLTSVAGVFGGDLDPTKGMYWTWQSGYINFKLEGQSKICPARNHQFQFHLGGYQTPFNLLQEVILETEGHTNFKINMAIDQLLAPIDLAATYQIMSPNQQALEMAQSLPSIFSIAK